MGYFALFCSFCSGPLEDAHEAWLDYLADTKAPWPPKDGGWRNPPGYPVPAKSKEEIVSISPEDGAFWDDWVCVGPMWKEDWVSPPCVDRGYGAIFIDGSDDWQNHSETTRYLRIHRGCLSFVCRRLGIVPRTLWESLYQPGSDYARYGEAGQGLLYCPTYYEMDGRNGQDFAYALTRWTRPREDDPDCVDCWDDPDSMEDTAWILTRPTALPIPPPIAVGASWTASESGSKCMTIFAIPELLDFVLSLIVEITPQGAAKELMHEFKGSATAFDPVSLISATKTLFALGQVNRFFHDALLVHRQGLFLLLASQYGWMLPTQFGDLATTVPTTPADWKEWCDRSGPDLDLRLEQPLDWRAYLLTFMRKEDSVVKNRWRLHRMSVQFARGLYMPATETEAAWRWSVGSLGLRSNIVPPDPWAWELHGGDKL
ncbi:hypothetical protein B0H16DRAFT_1300620 [Mycena metata]|uniref:Uncharacterized protein n=1 Tax=Mycena metata TaxID=1033252 RepID=A0AAD7K6D4_9AGAR|nr:hypothetical protein B0H16DRAFT_1300620 [Mycena metata]